MPKFTVTELPPAEQPKRVKVEDAEDGEVYVTVGDNYVFLIRNTGEIVRYDYIDPETSGLKVDKPGRAKLISA